MRGQLLVVLGAVAGLYAQEIRFTQVASGIAAPTDIQNAGDGSGRLFLAQQNGIVRVLAGGVVKAEPFLDIRRKTAAEGERGLLGLAFPPAFASTQRFYVNYTDLKGDTIIAQYHVTADPDVADVASEVVLLKIAQPYANHNGGQLRFGPDGYLYIGMGDGGSGGDPQGNGQNRDSLLGKMLRLDVESEPGRVLVPPDNPFVNTTGARPEIWALGLRNPWRFTFDRATRDLWIADVGQDTYEEIDFQPAGSRGGENYGWNRMEGAHCFGSGCDGKGLTLPVAEYTHADGCSVTGGFVYRGSAVPALGGTYVYGDLCSGRIWGVARNRGSWTNRLLATIGSGLTTFGEDEAGEIYIANASSGTIHRISDDQASSTAAFFSGQVALNDGSYYLEFSKGEPFGYYSHLGAGWIDHLDLGYEYAYRASSGNGIYLWDFTTGHWWYTSRDAFPLLYDFALSSWLYYFPNPENPGHYTTNPRYFLQMTTNRVFTM